MVVEEGEAPIIKNDIVKVAYSEQLLKRMFRYYVRRSVIRREELPMALILFLWNSVREYYIFSILF